MFQFPCPLPPGTEPPPPMGSSEQLFFCLMLVWMAVMLLSMCLPRPMFLWVFRMLYPWMPEKLHDD